MEPTPDPTAADASQARPAVGSTARRGGFYWRAFVTFYIVLSFTVLLVSGIILFIAPPGRIANWSSWSVVFLDKARWQAVHTILSLLFIVAAGFHVFFNWRVIVGYVRTRMHEGMRRKWELAGATGAVAAVLALTIGGIQPFQSVIDLGETIKNSWSSPVSEPPVPHAEEWTVAAAAENAKLPVEQVVENLRRAGFAVDDPATTTLQMIAARAGVVPQEVYRKARGVTTMAGRGTAAGASGGGGFAEGGGWGRRTVRQVAEQAQVPLADALSRLAQRGIRASADSTIRELAQAAGVAPTEVARIVQTQ